MNNTTITQMREINVEINVQGSQVCNFTLYYLTVNLKRKQNNVCTCHLKNKRN